MVIPKHCYIMLTTGVPVDRDFYALFLLFTQISFGEEMNS